ncbi:FeoA family protein [Acetonema longum]|uniref:FeoA family protein n=1 Tax=Acetonema longum DSM 6540 TaxID=1009370 RepID=F7NMJ1_9FIRM|nr:ferrous iron transport protein A [Acetonema longum]EGO62731.1 FeoA family protein [Acetonema longum DSM 6540]
MNKPLSQLVPGQAGKVSKITGNSAIQRRMVNMGLAVGTKVEVQKYAPLGDPIEIKLKGFNLSLRKAEAALIVADIAADTDNRRAG